MKGWFRKAAKRGRALLCVVLALVMALSCFGANTIAVYAEGAERTFDIGVNPGSVTASLDENGLLTVSGSGDIKDYTAETAPFLGCGVKALKLGADIKTIGSYAFYGCGELTGVIELPKGLVRIGDYAFSGAELGSAPKPELVRNPFTEALVTRKKDELGSPSPLPSEEPAESGTDPASSALEEEEPVSSSVPAETAATASDSEAVATSESGTVSAAESEAAGGLLSTEAEQKNATPSPSPESQAEESSPAESSAAPKETETASPEPSKAPESSAPSQEDDGNQYAIETLTQQEIGTGIFYPQAGGAFTCSPGNESFRAAMTAAGYQEAEGMLTAAFDPGEGSCEEGVTARELPVVNGAVTLPEVLPGFSAPEGGSLCSYAFGGWTESQDAANTAREAGSLFPAAGRESLYFIANWNRKVLIKIEVKRDRETVVFSVPQPEGYDLLSFRWQACELADGQEIPGDQDVLLWEDIPGADAQEYRREPEPGDESRLFRCVVTAKKRQNALFALFSAAQEEELALEGVYGMVYAVAGSLVCLPGEYAGATITGGTVTVDSEDGYVTIPEPEDCGYSCSGGTNLVFNGWEASDAAKTIYDPGMIVKLPDGGLTLTARWGVASVVYVKQDSWSASGGQGTSINPYYNLGEALSSSRLQGDSVYTNIVMLQGDNFEDGVDLFTGEVARDRVPGTLTPPAAGATITSANAASPVMLTTDINDGGFKLGGAIRFKDIKLQRGTSGPLGGTWETTHVGDDIYAQGNKLIMGKGVSITGNLALFGGNKAGNLTSGSPVLIVKSGTYTGIFGGNYQDSSGGATAQVHLGGTTAVNVTGSADEAAGNVYGGSQQAGSTSAGAEVYISGGTYGGSIYGGGQAGDSTKSCSVVVTGTAKITGSVFGGCMGGADGSGNYVGNVTGDTAVYMGGREVTVGGGVYGGGQGNEGQNNGSVSGSAQVAVRGGCSVTGGVYGGCQNGNLEGSGSVTVGDSATVTGSVYGGGQNGDLGGSSSVAVEGSVSVGGSVYGGGDQGLVARDSSVSMSGGTVGGNVFGGSRGTESSEVGKVSGSASVNLTGGAVGTYTGDGEINLADHTGNVFGGGEFAPVTGDSSVTVNVAEGAAGTAHDPVGGSVYGGGSQANVGGTSTAELQSGVVRGSVYGGGFGAGSVSQNAEASLSGGTVGGSLYGGGAQGTVTNGTAVTLTGGAVTGSVFGAGQGSIDGIDAGRVGSSSSVVMSGGGVSGSVHGGGDLGVVGAGSLVNIPAQNDGDVSGNSTTGSSSVTLSGGTVAGSVFGGGSGTTSGDGTGGTGTTPPFGTIFGSTKVSVTGGEVRGSVYGGCNFAYVTNVTDVTVDGSAGTVTVGGSAFGGGNMDGDPTQGYKTDVPLIFGGSRVRLIGPDLTLGGGLFGSGNLTTVYGVRTVSVEGFPDGLTLTAIQRANTALILNSKLTVVGESDKSLPQETHYSLTRIDDLKVQNSTLCLKAEVRELRAVESLDASGNPTTSAQPLNTIQASPGLLVRIRYTDDGGSTVYGSVSGVFWLEMAEQPKEGAGVRVEAGVSSDIGTHTAPDTGAFLRKESSLNLNPAPEPGMEGSYLEMTSGTVGDSYNYWRLGGTIIQRKLTLTAPKGAAGIVTVSDYLNIPTSESATVYKITGLKKTSGSFDLVLPTETDTGMTFTLGEGQSADSTFALRVEPTASVGESGWADLEANRADWGAYLLTGLPQGQSSYNSGVDGVWKRGTGYPATLTGGADGEVTFTLAYEGAYQSFSGGELEITFQEYPQGGPMTEDYAQNTVVVKLTLKGDDSGTVQSAAVAQGRTFSKLDSTEAVSIIPAGAVTASFLTEYTPGGTGADNMLLNLCQLVDGSPVLRSLPTKTRIVMCDMSSDSEYRYYYYETTADQAQVALSSFNSCSGRGQYAGPAVAGERITEQLLFAVDFSGATDGLLNGEGYFLSLTHSAEEQPGAGARAEFSATEEEGASLLLQKDEASTTAFVWGVTFLTTVPPKDTRYADGVSIHVSLKKKRSDGSTVTVGFPDQVSVTGAEENVLRDRNNNLCLTLPSAGSSTVGFDFSAVPASMFGDGTFQVTASMGPRAGLQMNSDGGAPNVSDSVLEFTLTREAAKSRSISAALTGGSRLADVSEAPAQLSFDLDCRDPQEGDRLQIGLYEKTGDTPGAESYTALSSLTGWSVTAEPAGTAGSTGEAAFTADLSGSGGTVTVTVPKSAKSQTTYRVWFRIVDSGGRTVAEEPYNFIVK